MFLGLIINFNNKLQSALPIFPPNPPHIADIKPDLLGKYLHAFLIAHIKHIPNPNP